MPFLRLLPLALLLLAFEMKLAMILLSPLPGSGTATRAIRVYGTKSTNGVKAK